MLSVNQFILFIVAVITIIICEIRSKWTNKFDISGIQIGALCRRCYVQCTRISREK